MNMQLLKSLQFEFSEEDHMLKYGKVDFRIIDAFAYERAYKNTIGMESFLVDRVFRDL